MNAPVSLGDMKNQVATVQDTRVDMFSARGFALAQRIANAFASSDAVPAQFRSANLKRSGKEEVWVENQSAIGNCIVALEVAQAVGMSVTAVMQNADIIEGKLRWSGKFVIAAINASGRFTPLRFDIQNLGRIKASYKEKGAWNNEQRRYDMHEKTIEVENLQCIAWALPAGMLIPKGVYTLAQARTAGLPVVESAPVSIRMAVEEGWYSKAGSKWQTEMKHLMLQYRAGTFFGNIHAPDIVMGMGRTAEEAQDIVDVQPDGSYTVTRTVDDLRGTPAPAAEVVASETPASTPAPVPAPAPQATQTEAKDDTGSSSAHGSHAGETFEDVKQDLLASKTLEDLDYARSLIKQVPSEEDKAELNQIASQRMREIAPPQDTPAQTTTRRTRAPINAD